MVNHPNRSKRNRNAEAYAASLPAPGAAELDRESHVYNSHMLVVDGGRAIWLELKSAKGRVSSGQDECHRALKRAGSMVFVVRSLDEAIDALRMAGVPLRLSGAA